MKCDFRLVLVFLFQYFELLHSLSLVFEMRIVEIIWSLDLPHLDLLGLLEHLLPDSLLLYLADLPLSAHLLITHFQSKVILYTNYITQ